MYPSNSVRSIVSANIKEKILKIYHMNDKEEKIEESVCLYQYIYNTLDCWVFDDLLNTNTIEFLTSSLLKIEEFSETKEFEKKLQERKICIKTLKIELCKKILELFSAFDRNAKYTHMYPVCIMLFTENIRNYITDKTIEECVSTAFIDNFCSQKIINSWMIKYFFDILFMFNKNVDTVVIKLIDNGSNIPISLYKLLNLYINKPTNEQCIVSYEPLTEYKICKSNVPHYVTYEVYEQLDTKKCPYCRSDYENRIYKNQKEVRRSQREKKTIERLMY